MKDCVSRMPGTDLKDALEYFENNTKEHCEDCLKAYDFTCSWANAKKCYAYRWAIYALSKIISENPKRLVALPCKAGDTVWFIRQHSKDIIETTIEKMVMTETGLYMKLSCNKMYETSCNSIGKTVFFTRAEAEEAAKND